MAISETQYCTTYMYMHIWGAENVSIIGGDTNRLNLHS